MAARIAGAGGFETYPRIEMGIGAVTLALCVALPLLAAVPFALAEVAFPWLTPHSAAADSPTAIRTPCPTRCGTSTCASSPASSS